MDDRIQIGLNIRALRKAYGETQEELGAAINYEKTTINNYEKGRRNPEVEILSEIAKHYMVSLEELTSIDLTGIDKISIDKNAFWRNIEIVFPLIKTDAAMKNEHFHRAFDLHQELYNKLRTISLEKMDTLHDCCDEYLEAYDDEVSKAEAAGNFLGLWSLIAMMIKLTSEFITRKPAALEILAKTDKEVRKIMDSEDSTMDADSKEALNGLNDPVFLKLINEMKIELKRSLKWSDLADYYIALDYVYNNVENGLEWDFNRRIGSEMMHSFASVGNLYAKRFIRFGIEPINESSQSVNDK